jgi:hypothetical protein
MENTIPLSYVNAEKYFRHLPEEKIKKYAYQPIYFPIPTIIENDGYVLCEAYCYRLMQININLVSQIKCLGNHEGIMSLYFQAVAIHYRAAEAYTKAYHDLEDTTIYFYQHFSDLENYADKDLPLAGDYELQMQKAGKYNGRIITI